VQRDHFSTIGLMVGEGRLDSNFKPRAMPLPYLNKEGGSVRLETLIRMVAPMSAYGAFETQGVR